MRTNLNKEEKNQPIILSIKTEVKIVNLAVHLEKIIAQLNDNRELSIPINWFEK
jgi:hypothetical protein